MVNLLALGCSPTATIKIDGSSTVYPITEAMPAAGYAYAKDYHVIP
ncbi:hypothetical protein LC653_14055 [Nostoc sp. CHAB 5784]|nr:hypothetical protein [Nostoc mirabile]MCC5665011.1 hypothetical protein [Nostoc mirabile CHAB5784]